MAQPHADSLLAFPENYDPALVAYELAKMPLVVERLIQVLHPDRSTDRAYGTTVALPVDVQPFSILPYDRSRVRSIVKVPANAGAGVTVAIGGRSDVGSGGGYVMYPGDSLTIESCAEVTALVSGPVGTVVQLSRWVEIQAD